MKIAHFSDVHALSFDSARTSGSSCPSGCAGLGQHVTLNRKNKHQVALFESLAEELNRQPPDEVVVTGDLTNLSLEPEFRLARNILDRFTLVPLLVTVFPGNHDVYTWDALRARQLFERHIALYAVRR